MKLASAHGRWVAAGAVLGSGAVFLEGSVVSVALPAHAAGRCGRAAGAEQPRDAGSCVRGRRPRRGDRPVGGMVRGVDGRWSTRGRLARGQLLLALFFVVERRSAAPLLPFDVFSSRQFTGANITTLFVHAALSGLFLLLMLELQNVLGYSAWISAGLCVAGALVAWLTIGSTPRRHDRPT